MPGKVGKSRTPELAQGINKLGRSASCAKNHRYLYSKNKVAAAKAPAEVAKSIVEPKFYSADDVARPIPSRKSHHKPARLRASITPGTVLILLAGRFRGKRVVFLKQLPSGLLLVTGQSSTICQAVHIVGNA